MAWKSIAGTIQKNTIDGMLRVVVDGEATDINSGALTGELALDSDLETQTTPTEDNKFVSRHGLIYWWNWLKTQAVNITGSWQFSKLGAGVAANISAFISLGLNTASIGQLYIPPSTVDYTGSIIGMLWNNTGEFKFLDVDGISNRLFKWNNNELGISDGNYVVVLNQYGSASANIKVTERWVFNTDVIDAIAAATFVLSRDTITPANDAIMFRGQMYDDGTYTYEAIEDNIVRRW